MIVTVDLGPLTAPELDSWVLAFTSARKRAQGPFLTALDALLDAGTVERIRRSQGGTGSRPQRVILADPDLDPALAAEVRDELIVRVSAYRDAPWIGPRLADALHDLLLSLADERDRVRRENERVQTILDSRYFRGSAPA